MNTHFIVIPGSKVDHNMLVPVERMVTKSNHSVVTRSAPIEEHNSTIIIQFIHLLQK